MTRWFPVQASQRSVPDDGAGAMLPDTRFLASAQYLVLLPALDAPRSHVEPLEHAEADERHLTNSQDSDRAAISPAADRAAARPCARTASRSLA